MSRDRFERLAGWSYRHRRRVVAAWVAALVAVSGLASLVGSDYHNDFSLPGTESQEVVDTLQRVAPHRAGDTIQLVVADRAGLTDAGTRERVERLAAEIEQLPGVAHAATPYGDGGALSRDGRIGYATITLEGQSTDVPKEDVTRLIDTAHAAAGDGMQVELGGDAVRDAEESEGGSAEGVGMLAALVVLVLLFGSLLAAALPLVTAVFAVGATIGLIALASNAADVADFTPPLMSLVGLGVGIDYALLIFSRYRSEVLGGHEGERAVRVALTTAGRSVTFAAGTVVIALLGLYVLGLASLQGVALAVALTVLVTMVASLTLLPAMLGILGPRLERGVRRRADRRPGRSGEGWRRWSALVQRRPWQALAAAVALLLAIAIPVTDLRLGFADAGNDADTTTSRRAYELVAEGFGPGFNGPLLVVSEGDASAAQEVRRSLERTPGIARVTPPSRAGEVSTLLAFPTTGPQDEATEELLGRLRGEILPSVERETGARVLVGGSTAAAGDFAEAVSDRLPLFLAVVVGLSALLLFAVFRSVLIPLKAALLNLLSIGAALGIVTLVFQEGLFGAQPGPIEAFIPVMIFAIVFGLSMDYEVFLVSRMQEEWQRSRDPHRAIGVGLATTGRVITAAGAIMIVVFGAFVLSPERMLQQFGLGLAAAIALDAFVIRSLVLPAAMQLLGERAWWPHARTK
jgi:putative drug exporter of the RND superfamily